MRTPDRQASSGPPTAAIVLLFAGFLAVFGVVVGFSRYAENVRSASTTVPVGQVAGASEVLGDASPIFVSDAPTRQPDVPDFDGILTARTAAVLDSRSGSVLFAKNTDLVVPLASLTKLAAATVYLESDHDLNAEVALIDGDVVEEGSGPSRLAGGEVIRARDLFFISLVASSNTATHAIARSTGLDRNTFVGRMNDLAGTLGLSATRFVDPTGLSRENVSTALEVARLAEYAFRSILVREATTTPTYAFTSARPATRHRFTNTDKLLSDGIALRGGKTGSTDESRYSFAALVSDPGGREIIVVVLGAASDERRFSEAKALSQWAFSAYGWAN